MEDRPKFAFVGNSHMAFWALNIYFPQWECMNYGAPGEGLAYVESFSVDTSDCYVVVQFGTNDIYRLNDENADEYFAVNTIGTINVLEYCRKNKIQRVISNCSYADVCGAWGKRTITEEEPRDFIYSGDHAVYVFSKNAANDVMEYYNQQHGMKNAWFRFPPVYGVGPHLSLIHI